MTHNNKERIDDFFADLNTHRLISSSARWQPLHICYPKEVNVSRFLAWLLDPTEGHGLGDLAIQSLLTTAWCYSDYADIDAATMRFLSPANVQTEAFSACMVTTEVVLRGRLLDVLVVDPIRRRYIAIENKFGAYQSTGQLKHYRQQLKKLLPDFLGVHIFLDSNEAEPEDSTWIPIGYDWLAEFLREAEAREATAQHVREALAQFREIIQYQSEEAISGSDYGQLVTQVAASHPDVLRLMKQLSAVCRKGTRVQTLAELMREARTEEGDARLRLFHLYWRRTEVWEDCIRQLRFAPFVAALRERFDDLVVDPKRVKTAFSLHRWEPLVDQDVDHDWYHPAGISVSHGEDAVGLVVFIQLNDVRPEKRDALSAVAAEIRKAQGVKSRAKEEQTLMLLRRFKGLTLNEAIDEAVTQMNELQARLSSIV